MKFAEFLTYIALKDSFNVVAKHLYHGRSEYNNLEKDPNAIYSLVQLKVTGDSEVAEILYSFETVNGKDTFKMIHCDIFFKRWGDDMKDKLFIKNAKVSTLIDRFQ